MISRNWKAEFTLVSDLINEIEKRMQDNGLMLPADSENLSWRMNNDVFRIMYGLKPLIEHKIAVRLELCHELKDLEKAADEEMAKKFKAYLGFMKASPDSP